MALQKHKIPLALSSGMDTKTDEFNATSFKLVENLKYKKSPGLVKRSGNIELSTSVIGVESSQSNISAGNRLVSTDNSLLMYDNNDIYHYVSDIDKWKKLSNDTNEFINSFLDKCEYTEQNIINNVNQVISASINGTSDYEIYVALKSSNTSSTISPKLIVKVNSKQETNLIYYKEFTVSSIGVDAKISVDVISDQYAIIIFNNSSGGLQYIVVTMNSTTVSIGSITNLVVTLNPLAFDTEVSGGYIYLAAVNGSPFISVYKINQTGVVSSNTINDASAGSPFFVHISSYLSGFRVVYFEGGASSANKEIRHFGINTSLVSTYSAATLMAASASRIPFSVTAVSDNTNTYFFYTVAKPTSLSGTITTSPDNGDTFSIIYGIVLSDSNNSTVKSETEVITSSLIQTKACINNDRILLGVCRTYGECYTTDSESFYLINVNKTTLYKTVFGIVKYLTYFPLYGYNSIPKPYIDNDKVNFVIIDNITVSSASTYRNVSSSFEILVNVIKAVFDFGTNTSSYIKTAYGTYISGPILKLYDGASLSEASFLDTPFIFGSRQVTGGTVTGGNYGFAVVARWTDNYGKIHRGVPFTKTMNLTAGFAHEILIGGLAITDKERVKSSSTLNNVMIEIYQTTLNGTVYYLQETIANINFSNIFTFIADASIKTDTEVLYTESGELENDPPPNSNIITEFKNRLWTVGNNVISYSKELEENNPISFSELYKILNITAAGNITAVAGMDNVLVIFTEDSIFIISGEGPNNLGQGSSLTKPQPISSDIGCTEPNSVINTPEGIMFKGKKGIYILNRGLYVSYIGAAVEDYNDKTILSSKLVQNSNEIRFLLNDDSVLCYDYLYKKWNVETYTDVVDLAILNDTVYMLKSDGTIMKQDSTTFKDGSSYYSGKFETNWITVGSISVNGEAQTAAQGFQRLYTINILGKYKSAHELKISLAYNYNDTIIDYATITPSGTGVYQFEVKPSIQKCEAFKIVVEDQNQSGTGESMVISHILLEVGIRGSAQKVVSDSNRFSAT